MPVDIVDMDVSSNMYRWLPQTIAFPCFSHVQEPILHDFGVPYGTPKIRKSSTLDSPRLTNETGCDLDFNAHHIAPKATDTLGTAAPTGEAKWR